MHQANLRAEQSLKASSFLLLLYPIILFVFPLFLSWMAKRAINYGMSARIYHTFLVERNAQMNMDVKKVGYFNFSLTRQRTILNSTLCIFIRTIAWHKALGENVFTPTKMAKHNNPYCGQFVHNQCLYWSSTRQQHKYRKISWCYLFRVLFHVFNIDTKKSRPKLNIIALQKNYTNIILNSICCNLMYQHKFTVKIGKFTEDLAKLPILTDM